MKYGNVLKNLWLRTWSPLIHWDKMFQGCSNLEKDRVYDFLVGLNVEFDQVRVQILSKELPTLNETISIFQAEESKRSVMLEPHNMEGSTMVANKGSD